MSAYLKVATMSTPVPARRDAPQLSGSEAAWPGLLPRLTAEAFGSFFLAVAGLGVPLFTLTQSSPLPAALAASLGRCSQRSAGVLRGQAWLIAAPVGIAGSVSGSR